MTAPKYTSYPVWDLPVRLFHWINVLCILTLIAIGTVIMWGDDLGLSIDGTIMIKTVHVYVGYIFAVNLIIRLIWGFIGNRFARWGHILPFEKGFIQKLKAYIAAEKAGAPQQYQGHNPLGRLAVSIILLALLVMAVSGLVLAGTDIYFPPFGTIFQQWIVAAGANPSDIMPYVKDYINQDTYKAMKDFREPFGEIHELTFYTILGLIVLHIAAVIRTEIKSGGGLISAMFTGKKVLPKKPEDS